jgi:hypothetical protein
LLPWVRPKSQRTALVQSPEGATFTGASVSY